MHRWARRPQPPEPTAGREKAGAHRREGVVRAGRSQAATGLAPAGHRRRECAARAMSEQCRQALPASQQADRRAPPQATRARPKRPGRGRAPHESSASRSTATRRTRSRLAWRGEARLLNESGGRPLQQPKHENQQRDSPIHLMGRRIDLGRPGPDPGTGRPQPSRKKIPVQALNHRVADAVRTIHGPVRTVEQAPPRAPLERPRASPRAAGPDLRRPHRRHPNRWPT